MNSDSTGFSKKRIACGSAHGDNHTLRVSAKGSQPHDRSTWHGSGLLIINADDWGRDSQTTLRILECIHRQTVSSTSAMVFMTDSERAAAIAREEGIDAGLHLNLTTPLSATDCPCELRERHRPLVAFFQRHRFARVVFNPFLLRNFEYVVRCQIDEFQRLYGRSPDRIDGHHHVHLCANVLMQGLLPANIRVRRNFSFRENEKGSLNRAYRAVVDRFLARRHHLTDFLFPLLPLQPSKRLARIVHLAKHRVVEVETHPVNPEEYQFLMGAGVLSWVGDVPIAPRYAWESHEIK